MRIKTCRGRSRLSQTPTRRSHRSSSGTARALPVLLRQDDEFENHEQSDRTRKIVPETLSDSNDNGDDVGATVQKEVDLNAHIGNNNDRQDSIEEGNCIRCKGIDEQVLVCSGIGCLIWVHEKCMGCNPWFDDLGKFYCPFCKQKRVLARVREMRRKVKDAKKALLTFLEGSKVGGNKGKEKQSRGDDRNETCNVPSVGDGICQDVRVKNQFADVEKEDEHKGMENVEPGCVDQDTIVLENEVVQPNTSVVNIDDDASFRKEVSGEVCLSELRGHETPEDGQEEDLGLMDDSEDERIGKDKEDDLGERNADGAFKVSNKGANVRVSKNNQGIGGDGEQMEPETLESPANSNAIPETDSFSKCHGRFKRRAGRTTRVQNVSPSIRSSPQLKKAFVRQKASAKKNVSLFYEKATTSTKIRESAKQHITVNNPVARRTRLHWTADEEHMLREGIKDFCPNTNVKIPWMKILEYGRHVFHETRSPSDLKNKWRNMVDKEGAS
ncbi:hypothetical protein L484_017729 [Morus notabilis]|uniref:Myb-like domain-containing protein n=1 Tax=Morus notabilis TaxID=981085 RepID=W9SC24_9ROSA|nr:uncharacterized protein LOC21400716 [Morus notabilis]XP_024032161.1 uncharacterized protein LOC21400716 [Morus notabilis]EXC35028.1 hypothetical protein L484_017729 [Morus notabilis]